MKAIVYYEFGLADRLQVAEVDKPVPADEQVLLRVRAASVNPLDWHLLKGGSAVVRKVFGIAKPTRQAPGRAGRDVAGEVEAVGGKVTRFKPGDRVFGVSPASFAEYALANEAKLVALPDNVTFEQGGAVGVAAITALQGLRDHGKLQPGHKVLINGASGGVGTFAVQLAKALGAEVTGVCSTGNVEMVRSIGADHVIDYTKEDFTQGSNLYDLALDNMFNKPIGACRRNLKPGGKWVIVGGPQNGRIMAFMTKVMMATLLSRFTNKRFVMFMANLNQKDLTLVAGMMATGKVTPVIDRTYPLAEAANAVGYAQQGHARGKVVVTVP